jgi:hypothetical protein
MKRPAQAGEPAGRHRRGASDLLFLFSNHYGTPDQCGSDAVGTVGYRPDPVDAPADGNVLICCSQPDGDIVIDL